uniref:Swi5-dependent recombination DNA repair protein 1 homolog n=1 Tax=Trichuris muris TaxID=70415 RepID=A0A5S6QHZ2_TRIMR
MYSPALREKLRKQGRAYYSPIRGHCGGRSCNANFGEVTGRHHSSSTTAPTCANEAAEILSESLSTTESPVQPFLGDVGQKRDFLRRLRIVERYRAEEALSKVELLIPKWLNVCQDVVQRVWRFLPEPRPSLAEFLRQLHVDLDLIQFDEAEDSFRS